MQLLQDDEHPDAASSALQAAAHGTYEGEALKLMLSTIFEPPTKVCNAGLMLWGLHLAGWLVGWLAGWKLWGLHLACL